MDALAAATAVAKLGTAFLEKQIQSSGQHNTQEMLAAEYLQNIGDLVDQHREHIKNQNLEAFRKDVAPPGAGA